MRRTGAIVVGCLALIVAACTAGSDELSADVAGATSCRELTDVVLDRLQTVVDVAGDMSTEEVSEALNDASGGDGPFAFAMSDRAGEEITQRTRELDCEDIDVTDLCDRLATIDASGPAATDLLAALLRPCEEAAS